jgi:pimeloyl-ACP methyl ester carboxylesterase
MFATSPLTAGEMAQDMIAVISALGHKTVDLLGFSLGGFVAQGLVLKQPDLVRKLILTGTGPAGGEGIDRGGAVSWPLIIRGMLTFREPKFYLFFTRTANGKRAAKAFLARLKERAKDRDKGLNPRACLRQLKAIQAWGRQMPQDLGRIRIPTLVANGDNDTMMPTQGSHDMARRIPLVDLVIYPDVGHGGIFQYHETFVPKALDFLAA